MEALQEIIDEVKTASAAIDRASDRAKASPELKDTHLELESIWCDIDILFKKLTEQQATYGS
jgi:hypothetical protein